MLEGEEKGIASITSRAKCGFECGKLKQDTVQGSNPFGMQQKGRPG